MIFLEFIEILVIAFIIVEVGIPLILGIKIFPVFRNLRSRKAISDVKEEIEAAVNESYVADQERLLAEKKEDVQQIKQEAKKIRRRTTRQN